MTIRNNSTVQSRISVLVAIWFGLSSGLLWAQKQPELPPLPITEPTVPSVEPVTPLVEPDGPAVDRNHGCGQPFEGKPPARLGKKIDQALANKDLIGAHVGILAVAYPEGRILYARNANLNVNPASVTKLFTAATALALLGPEHRFVTGLYQATGDCPPIYVRGGGDPGLEVKDLKTLADKAREAGVNCAEKLVVDVSVFDEQILPPHYEQKKSDAHWRPKIGALGVADGALNVRVFPGDYPDAAPRVTVDPDCSCLMVDSRAVTAEEVEEGHHLAVSVGMLNGKTVVQLTGQVPMKKKKGILVRKAIPHPDMYSACILRDLMRSHGIKVKTKVVEVGKVPAETVLVASVKSNSLKTDLRRMQRWSKNFVAEQFVKLAGEGTCEQMSFKCGLKQMRRALERFHINPSCVQWENGSGLFDANRFSPAQVVRLLIEMANKEPWAEIYRKALPLGGASGTLKDRMKKVKRPVRAKTGTLDHHSSLAGYIDRRGGGYIAFAILFADAKTTAYRMRRLQDLVVEYLAAWTPKK